MQRLVAAITRLLETTERCSHVAAIVLVNPHAAGAQSLGRQVCLGDVRRPHRRSQAVLGVVGDGDGFFGAVESDHRQDGAKDLFLGDLHGIGHAVENRRLDVGAAGLFQGAFATRDQLGAIGVASFNVRKHGVHLLRIHQCTHSGGWVQWIAGFPALEGLDHQRQEGVLDRTLDQQARAGSADFALVEGNGAGGGFGRRLQVRRVGKHDVRALATGFQPYTLHVRLAGADQQLLGDLGGAREHQGIDVHMHRQGVTHGVAIARQHVEHAFWNTSLNGQRGDADGGERGFFGRLQDDRVAGRQRRAEFPAGHHQREVPRHDGANDADGLAGHQAQLIVGRGGDFVVDLVDRLAAPAQGLRRAGDVDVQGIADGFAHVQGFEQRQLFGVSLEQRGETDHDGLALGWCQARPHAGIESGTRIFHGALGIAGITAGDSGQQAPIHRADAFEGVTGNGGGVFAIDIGAAFDFQSLGALFPVGTGQGGHASVLLLLNTRAWEVYPGAITNACPASLLFGSRQLPP